VDRPNKCLDRSSPGGVNRLAVMLKPPFELKAFDVEFLVEPRIRPCCGSIFFARSLGSGRADDIVDNGSFVLVETGTRRLLLTCHHVWDGFQNLRSNNPESKLCMCLNSNTIVPIEPIQPIDEDKDLDIASFDVGPFLEQHSDIEFFHLNCNDVPHVNLGDWLVFLGFPGRIEAHTSIGVRFVRRFHASRAYDVTDRRVFANLTRLKPNRQEPELVGRKGGYGGISGAPCFLLRKNLVPQLVALATENAYEHLSCILLNCLNSDGTISR
jgi:hypothetical protein